MSQAFFNYFIPIIVFNFLKVNPKEKKSLFSLGRLGMTRLLTLGDISESAYMSSVNGVLTLKNKIFIYFQYVIEIIVFMWYY